jgi:YHS domain-containing protein
MNEPVFVFLPVTDGEQTAKGLAIDPVCGRALEPGCVAGRLIYGGIEERFCSLDCASRFAAKPDDFGKAR